MSEHGTGTGTRIKTGTGTGTKLEMVILRAVLVIPEFEHRTEFRESRELVRSFDSSASRADEFQGGTSARGVTGSGLAKICQQSHMIVTGHNTYVIYIFVYGQIEVLFGCMDIHNIIIVYPANTLSKVEKRQNLFSTEIPAPNNPSMVLKHHPSPCITCDVTL